MKETAFAEKLRTAHGLALGGALVSDGVPVLGAVAPNGKPYVTLQGFGGEDEATEAFAAYMRGRVFDVLYWRTLPEFIPRYDHVSRKRIDTWYMRLLAA